MKRPTAPPPRSISLLVEGNKGGSYIQIDEIQEGIIRLQVGESCVHTIDTEISVVALAAILTAVHDGSGGRGFVEFLRENWHSPEWVVDQPPFTKVI